MFEYLKGILTELSLDTAIVEVGGVGYKLFIPINQYGQFPPIGERLTIYVSTVIREDSHKNFGFLRKEQRELFEMLGEVSGIGPKTALSLVSYMEEGDLKNAIAQANIPLLSKIPGIGKKTAERIVVEIRDKIEKKKEKVPLTEVKEFSNRDTQLLYDAQRALIHLGYNPLQAQRAIKRGLEHCKANPSIGDLISASLQNSKSPKE